MIECGHITGNDSVSKTHKGKDCSYMTRKVLPRVIGTDQITWGNL